MSVSPRLRYTREVLRLMLTVPDACMTHAGVFHADDVFASALLRLLNPQVSIRRVRELPEEFCGLAFDIGGGEFDHHQRGSKKRPDGVSYSSFGLLWKCFGSRLLDEEGARIFDEEFVRPIDIADSSGTFNSLSRCVSDFNPIRVVDDDEYDRRFAEASSWAQGVLERRLSILRAEHEDALYVRRLMDAGDGRVLVLPEFRRWRRAVVGSGYKFVIYPSLRGGFNVQGVPRSSSGPELVRAFPLSWRGLSPDDLRKLSGIEDLVFCHATGFLCATKTLGGARAVARLAMRGEEGT